MQIIGLIAIFLVLAPSIEAAQVSANDLKCRRTEIPDQDWDDFTLSVKGEVIYTMAPSSARENAVAERLSSHCFLALKAAQEGDPPRVVEYVVRTGEVSSPHGIQFESDKLTCEEAYFYPQNLGVVLKYNGREIFRPVPSLFTAYIAATGDFYKSWPGAGIRNTFSNQRQDEIDQLDAAVKKCNDNINRLSRHFKKIEFNPDVLNLSVDGVFTGKEPISTSPAAPPSPAQP